MSEKIKLTKELMLKLAKRLREEADELPEYSMFGTKNDLEGMRKAADLAEWCVENFEEKILKQKVEDLLETLDEVADNDDMYERYSRFVSVVEFALGKDNTIYYDYLED